MGFGSQIGNIGDSYVVAVRLAANGGSWGWSNETSAFGMLVFLTPMIVLRCGRRTGDSRGGCDDDHSGGGGRNCDGSCNLGGGLDWSYSWVGAFAVPCLEVVRL